MPRLNRSPSAGERGFFLPRLHKGGGGSQRGPHRPPFGKEAVGFFEEASRAGRGLASPCPSPLGKADKHHPNTSRHIHTHIHILPTLWGGSLESHQNRIKIAPESHHDRTRLVSDSPQTHPIINRTRFAPDSPQTRPRFAPDSSQTRPRLAPGSNDD